MFIDKKTLLKFVNLVPVVRGVTKEGEVFFSTQTVAVDVKNSPKRKNGTSV